MIDGDGEDRYKQMEKEMNVLFHRESETESDYRKCLIKANEFLNVITIENAPKRYFRFIYVTFSKIYNHLNDKEKALDNILQAKEYLTEEDEQTKHIIIHWQIGMCYKDIDNEKALEYLEKSYNMSAEMESPNYEFMGSILEELAIVTKNTDYLVKGIFFYKKAETESFIDKTKSLDSMYRNLFNLYMENGNIGKAIHIIHSINDKELAKELRNKIFRIA